MERSAEEPGRSCWVEAKATKAKRKDITVAQPSRESERPIVAKKRVTTVERRGLTESKQLQEEEKTAWMKIPLRRLGQAQERRSRKR